MLCRMEDARIKAIFCVGYMSHCQIAVMAG